MKPASDEIQFPVPDSLKNPPGVSASGMRVAPSFNVLSAPIYAAKSAVIDPNAYTPEFKGFLVKLEKA